MPEYVDATGSIFAAWNRAFRDRPAGPPVVVVKSEAYPRRLLIVAEADVDWLAAKLAGERARRPG